MSLIKKLPRLHLSDLLIWSFTQITLPCLCLYFIRVLSLCILQIRSLDGVQSLPKLRELYAQRNNIVSTVYNYIVVVQFSFTRRLLWILKLHHLIKPIWIQHNFYNATMLDRRFFPQNPVFEVERNAKQIVHFLLVTNSCKIKKHLSYLKLSTHVHCSIISLCIVHIFLHLSRIV